MHEAILAMTLILPAPAPEPPRQPLAGNPAAKIVIPAPPRKVAPHRMPTGPLHSHTCPYDGTTWTHGDDSFGNRAAHTCPKCGRVVWQVNQRNARPYQLTAPQSRATPPSAESWVTSRSVPGFSAPCPPGRT